MRAQQAIARLAPAGTAQAVAVALAVRPSLGFLAGSVGQDRPREFTSRRLGVRVCVRPQADRQVARELLSKNAYALPPEVRAALGDDGVHVLDLGANIGLFTLTIVDELGIGVTVDAVEPDAENLRILGRNLALSGLKGRVTVHAAAGGTAEGTATLIRHQPHNTHLARGDEVDIDMVTVPVLDALTLAKRADLVKIDIEGSEWDLLRDPRIDTLGARAIALEWHDHNDSPPDPGAWAGDRLRRAGFTVGHDEQTAPNTGFLWAWRDPGTPRVQPS